MKKKFFVGLIVLFCFLVPVQKVKADIDYNIKNVIATAKVNSDGSLSMNRKVTYKFYDSAHGVYYRQNLDNDQRLLKPKVKLKINGKNYAINKNNSQAQNTYQLSKSGNSYRFKLYHRIEDGDQFTAVYSYRITNAIANWKDTAELNFKIIGDGWDRDLDHVKAQVLFSKPVSDLRAWAHGELAGHIEVQPEKGCITMTANDVDRNVGVEVHAIFPVSVTDKNKKVINKNHKKAVISQEAKLAREANEKRRRRKVRTQILMVVAIVFSLLDIVYAFLAKPIGTMPKSERELPHNYEIPDVSAVQAQILDTEKDPDTRAFTAWIMWLAGKHKLKIEPYLTKRKKHQQYRIILIDKSLKKQWPILKYLFNKVGNKEEFTTADLRNFSGKKLSEKYSAWQDGFMDQAFEDGYFNEENDSDGVSRKIKLTLFAVLSVILLIVAGVFYGIRIAPQIWWLILGLLILTGISYFFAKKRIALYTEKGAEECEKVRGFKAMLKDIGNFKMRDVGELILWEDIMPYAVAFGLAKKVLKELKIEFGQEELEDSDIYLYTSFIDNSYDFDYLFEDALSDSIEASEPEPEFDLDDDSSTFGDSGGFSSGSSGGFGGGSGGGAF